MFRCIVLRTCRCLQHDTVTTAQLGGQEAFFCSQGHPLHGATMSCIPESYLSKIAPIALALPIAPGSDTRALTRGTCAC